MSTGSNGATGATGIITLPQSNKILYSLLRLFYVGNINDLYISTVIDVCKDFPIDQQTTWICALTKEIQSLPILGPEQQVKTNYVIQMLQTYLSNLSIKIAAGLPPV